jgi:D-serine deaminase-like pyridoxal phosphate-dependent protein
MQPILNLLRNSKSMTFQGFLTHAGHTYECRQYDDVLKIHRESKRLLSQLKDRYLADFPNLQLSVGDTPSCSILPASECEDVDEMRPGNFVFYDLEQASISSCKASDIAVAVACPIVAKHHPQRHEIILYGGGVHFSKDRLGGRVVARDTSRTLEWKGVVEGMHLKGVSQEHGNIAVVPAKALEDYNVGDLLFVLPVHSCMTADSLKYKGYRTTDNEHLERMKN